MRSKLFFVLAFSLTKTRAFDDCGNKKSCGECGLNPEGTVGKCGWNWNLKRCDGECWIMACAKSGAAPVPPAPPPPPLPAKCMSAKTGDNCDFYDSCLEAYQKCAITEKVMKPKCEEYEKAEGSLSAKGQAWSKYVRHCLQAQIADHVLKTSGAGFKCADVEAVFFHNHLPCYLTRSVAGLPWGFCSLSELDQLKVILHASSIFFSKYVWQGTESFIQLRLACLEHIGGIGIALVLPQQSRPPPAASSGPFPWPQLTARLNNETGKLGWTSTTLSNGTASGELTDEEAGLVLFQAAVYHGPTTPWPATNMTEDVATPLVAAAVHAVSQGKYRLSSYNGQPVDASMLSSTLR